MYKIIYLESVIKEDIKKLDNSEKSKIKNTIEEKLTLDPIGFGKPLQYSFKGCRRLRIGDWRVIYQINHIENSVLIVKIGHRKDVYK